MRRQLTLILVALAIALGGSALTARPAYAVFYNQCDPPGGGNGGTCLNFWNGGLMLATYQGVAYNNFIQIQWIGGGNFELRDMVHGGCVGDANNSPYDDRAEGGRSCPSSGVAGWGTIFSGGPACGNGYGKYYNRHWQSYVDFLNGNDHQVYLLASIQTFGQCLQQQA